MVALTTIPLLSFAPRRRGARTALSLSSSSASSSSVSHGPLRRLASGESTPRRRRAWPFSPRRAEWRMESRCRGGMKEEDGRARDPTQIPARGRYPLGPVAAPGGSWRRRLIIHHHQPRGQSTAAPLLTGLDRLAAWKLNCHFTAGTDPAHPPPFSFFSRLASRSIDPPSAGFADRLGYGRRTDQKGAFSMALMTMLSKHRLLSGFDYSIHAGLGPRGRARLPLVHTLPCPLRISTALGRPFFFAGPQPGRGRGSVRSRSTGGTRAPGG